MLLPPSPFSPVFRASLLAAALLTVGCAEGVREPVGPSFLPLPCDPWDEANGPAPPCDGDSGVGNEDPSPGQPGYWLPGSEPDGCFQSGAWDPDNDGIANACENTLAGAFAPGLYLARDCNWDPRFDRMGGEYYFAVQRGPGQGYYQARVAYLPAYYLDCGSPDDGLSWCRVAEYPPVRWFADRGCEAHTGDSEMIIVDISFDPTTRHWVADSVFLSAHCGRELLGVTPDGGTNGCNWFRWQDFEFRDVSRGAPVIWVAEGKHANYRSQAWCNTGASFNQDTCEYNTTFRVFPTGNGQQNIGSRVTPLRDCGPPLSGSAYGSPEVNPVECLWTETPTFRGWWGNFLPGGTTWVGADAYSRVLGTFALF